MTLRYGAVLTSLRSLRGDPATVDVTPTAAAVAYRERPARRGEILPLADVYVPAHANGASAILVHGGGFVIGSRAMKPMRYLVAQLTAAGIAVCAIDYRMIFRGGRIDEAIDDVCDAFAFWSARAPRHGLDPSKISFVGLSAGATLSLLAAARVDRLAGVVACFGLYDVAYLHGAAAILPRMLFGTADRAAWNARSPLAAPQPIAPTLLLHGTDDRLVPVEQAHRLAARRTAHGLPTRLAIYDGAPHGFFNYPLPVAAIAAREMIDHITGCGG